MNEPTISLRGNLTADPVEQTTNGGRKVLHIRVASNPYHKDPQTGQYVSDPSSFYGISLWDLDQISLYRGLKKGMQVRVEGVLRRSQGTGRDGQPVEWLEIDRALIALTPQRHRKQQPQAQPQSGYDDGFGDGDF